MEPKMERLLEGIPQQGILPLYFHKEEDVCLEVLRVLYRCGIRAVEFTNRGEAALVIFRKMRTLCAEEFSDMSLGIGTIKNLRAAEQFIEAGADFLISPGMVDEVAKIADAHNLLWIPGCMTPTEIIHAENLGARMVKLFPGNILGPEFMSSIKELFPGLKFMPTGGVDLDRENIRSWFKAGVCAVGMGSKLVSKAILEGRDYVTLENRTKEALAMVASLR